MTVSNPQATTKVATYCYQCVAGPDLLKVKVEDGVATAVEPNFDAEHVHPAAGRVCVKAFGLVQKIYNPNRVLQPMKRTNPKKGRHEDPGFVPISWDEALDTIAAKLRGIRETGLLDASGYPRVAASFGGGGTPTAYMGTFPAFLAAWGPVDMSFGSGQGVKCYHSEHLYGELWHRAFIVCPDTPRTKYILSFGSNIEASGGVCGVWRHAAARVEQGVKRVQFEPHLSVTGGCSAEWVPIKPKTDAACMHALIHVMLFENARSRLDIDFLKHRTASPYLVAPNGFYLRDPDTRKPLVWDLKAGKAVVFDTPGIDPALDGDFVASGLEVLPDEELVTHEAIAVRSAFGKLLDHERTFTPEWAQGICDVPAATIRRVANEYLDHAEIGATIEIEGRSLPFRPVAVTLGKTVNNGWGGYDCCWARTLMACLVGALDVPGGTIGTAVRLNRPANDRQSSAKPGVDGFMDYPFNPTDKENWIARPQIRNANRTLVPLVANSAWSAALGPTHLAWMQQRHGFESFPEPTQPDVWFFYRTNPVISFWDTPQVAEAVAKFPFVVAFSYTHDETNHFADILLPDRTDLEGLQMLRIGGTKYVEQFWDHQGFALRQPVVSPQGDTRDFTWISTELARRSGILETYNKAISRGAAGVPLKGPNYDFSLQPDRAYGVEEIWDASCRAASAELTEGAEDHGLEWWKEHGFRTIEYPRLQWYLYPHLVDQGLRFEMPYQERISRIGEELGRRLHESGIDWWDRQLTEYRPLPEFHDFSHLIKHAVISNLGGRDEDFPFWLLTARSMQYMWGGNVSLQMVHEVADNVKGHRGVIMNPAAARKLGIEDGDLVEVRSPLRETRGHVVLRQGIRPDTLLMVGQFDHWITPYAKDFNVPSMNALVPMLMDLTDATGSAADIVPVSIKRIGGAQ
ncbi:molybdopterin-dependent oxidoreductase [Thauera phenylacetica]|jgi:phenylacetyl-CoA:acceptor oxidoreductase|uniref:Molybdopterin oxidoreductase n=1 Tax=Thauera phenylacetica B4P TaxID=1234382 RepID=N6ZUL9_9RHOO|nr:molybdopterin-dependent oxidoreductase [Thauera phenylacetica]ENO98028.1 molybdopterin oxidoreductase [Thauera phenylacetica B4P]MBP7639155.1 molybdopterin-dependent oxidoreductase [Thauera sp.]HRM67878.1 molybdopterin-dependent oxidoreductase [Thauera phenylacetica]